MLPEGALHPSRPADKAGGLLLTLSGAPGRMTVNSKKSHASNREGWYEQT
jgi:hypothetical protein